MCDICLNLRLAMAIIEVWYFLNLYRPLQLILKCSLCAPSCLLIQEQPHL